MAKHVSFKIRTAHHEAGHAVIGRVMMQVSGGATVVPNMRNGSAGHSITVDPYLTGQYFDDLAIVTGPLGGDPGIRRQIEQRHRAWRRHYSLPERRSSPNSDAIMLGRIVTFMAGAEAEAEFFGSCAGGDGDDRRQIDMILDDLLSPGADAPRYAARLRRHARVIVHRHRDKIKRVAALLLERSTLSAKDIDRAMV